jgi:hypothetical protein
VWGLSFDCASRSNRNIELFCFDNGMTEEFVRRNDYDIVIGAMGSSG